MKEKIIKRINKAVSIDLNGIGWSDLFSELLKMAPTDSFYFNDMVYFHNVRYSYIDTLNKDLHYAIITFHDVEHLSVEDWDFIVQHFLNKDIFLHRLVDYFSDTDVALSPFILIAHQPT